jgi:hypothetical protein
MEADVSSPPLKYGVLDGDPFVINGEAWVFSNGAWKRESVAAVGVTGRVISKEAFDARFSSLPALPSNAFHSGSAAAKAHRRWPASPQKLER